VLLDVGPEVSNRDLEVSNRDLEHTNNPLLDEVPRCAGSRARPRLPAAPATRASAG
jgi:hypothetical protein